MGVKLRAWWDAFSAASVGTEAGAEVTKFHGKVHMGSLTYLKNLCLCVIGIYNLSQDVSTLSHSNMIA